MIIPLSAEIAVTEVLGILIDMMDEMADGPEMTTAKDAHHPRGEMTLVGDRIHIPGTGAIMMRSAESVLVLPIPTGDTVKTPTDAGALVRTAEVARIAIS